jgi:hypothetical protein
MTNPTDLAARFEAKRAECEKKARRLSRSDALHSEVLGRAHAFAEARDMARAGAAGGAGERVRHLKSGGEYEVLGEAELQLAKPQAERNYWSDGSGKFTEAYSRVHEGERLTVYRGADGKLWARFTDEFYDGRFETISVAPPSLAQQGFSPPLSQAERSCTCHPDDNPPQPCPERYAYSECVKAAPPPLAAERVALLPVIDWAAAAAQDARLKMADLPSGSETHAWFHAQAVAFEAAYDHAAAVAAAAPPPPAQQGSSSDHE